MNLKLVHPVTAVEFENYYHLRWEILRKPWGLPRGSERDELEETAFHLMAIDEYGKVQGVCRLHFIDKKKGQIRYMAVRTGMQGKGIGLMLLNEAESYAMKNGIQQIILQSRENAVGFYERLGFNLVEKSFLLFGEIQHFLMEKALI